MLLWPAPGESGATISMIRLGTGHLSLAHAEGSSTALLVYASPWTHIVLAEAVATHHNMERYFYKGVRLAKPARSRPHQEFSGSASCTALDSSSISRPCTLGSEGPCGIHFNLESIKASLIITVLRPVILDREFASV